MSLFPYINSSSFKQTPSENGFKISLTKEALATIEATGTYDRVKIDQKIQSLSAIPRPQDAGQRIGATDGFRIAVGYYRFDYVVSSGNVTITNVSLDSVDASSAVKEKPGLYSIEKNSRGVWKANPKRVAKVMTKFAAVNGMQNDLERAAGLMPTHIEDAFGKSVKNFTLFHNPTDGFLGDLWESNRDKIGFGVSTPLAKQLAAILKDAQDEDKSVSWVAHSQGGLIFTEAVRYHNRTRGTLLDNHAVKFHSGANNARVSARILNKAGVKKVGPDNNHPFDPVPNLIGLNAPNLACVVGSIICAPSLSDAGPLKHLKSSHTLPNKRENWKFWQWKS